MYFELNDLWLLLWAFPLFQEEECVLTQVNEFTTIEGGAE
jgi:hypothetical protein